MPFPLTGTLEVAILFGHGVFVIRPGSRQVEVPFELVQFVAEGGGLQARPTKGRRNFFG